MQSAPDASLRGSGPAPSRRNDILGLVAFVAICLIVSAVGGAATATSVDTWYQGLRKPTFNPPDWIFAPIWTTLYLMMAVAGWRIWRRYGFGAGRSALCLFAVQLALNLAWSFLFFGLQRIGIALAEILILLAAILATLIAFWRLDRAAGVLFVPYAAWVAFASALNAAIWRLN